MSVIVEEGIHVIPSYEYTYVTVVKGFPPTIHIVPFHAIV
jgi:hypothetical protein